MSDVFDGILEPDQVEMGERELELKRLRDMDHQDLLRMVTDFRDGTSIGQLQAEKSRRYYDGYQLDRTMTTALTRARQPRIIRNEIKPAINGILGLIQQAQVDPRAYPRNPDNEEQADVASKALRFVADQNRFHRLKVRAAENMLIEGCFGIMVEIDDRNDVMLNLVPYNQLIYDPRSREVDFSDAIFKGVGKWLYEGDLRRMYPDFADELSAAFSSNSADFGLGNMFEDKPNDLLGELWLDKGKRRIFVVELYHREGEWKRTVFYVGGVLEDGVSPYLDDQDQPTCPLVMSSCFTDNQNQRYGLVASMLSPQDELNAYASRSLHLANSRQLQAADPDRPPEVDSKTASAEAAKANGVIPVGWQVVPTADLFAGIQIMMENARQALVRQAPTPAVLANASATDQSGRSRLVLQQAGMTEIALALGHLEDGENDTYRQIWQRLRQFKTEPWWVRITGEDQKAEFVGLNQPVVMGADGQELPPELAQQAAQMGAPVSIKNNLAEMDVDIEVETIPDTANLQAEQFETISPMLPLLAQAIGPKKAFDVGMALSSFPDKQRIKELVDARQLDDPQAQQMAAMQQQLQQQAVQIEMQGKQLENAKTQGEIALNEAKTRQIDAEIVVKAADMEARSMGIGEDLQPQ